VERVVIAADSFGRAATASDANDADGVASEPNKDGGILHDDAQKGYDLAGRTAVSGLNAVAALNGASGTAAGGFIPTSRGGGRKGGESKSDNREFELHV